MNRVRLLVQVILAVAAIGTVVAVWLEHWRDVNSLGDPWTALLIMLTIVMVTERVIAVVSEFFEAGDRKKLERQLNRMPEYLAGSRDLVYFPSVPDGLEYCMAVAPMAKGVRNTVFRYVHPDSGLWEGRKNIYTKWIAKKRDCLKKLCP